MAVEDLEAVDDVCALEDEGDSTFTGDLAREARKLRAEARAKAKQKRQDVRANRVKQAAEERRAWEASRAERVAQKAASRRKEHMPALADGSATEGAAPQPSPASSPGPGESEDEVEIAAVIKPQVVTRVVEETVAADLAKRSSLEEIQKKADEDAAKLEKQRITSVYKGLANWSSQIDKDRRKQRKKEAKLKKLKKMKKKEKERKKREKAKKKDAGEESTSESASGSKGSGDSDSADSNSDSSEAQKKKAKKGEPEDYFGVYKKAGDDGEKKGDSKWFW
mmetsp:Transcript_21929/g.38526  ORF Transcript_21929/g.38526 Transcript_21929/m.38526 type:complete len:280 (-) Transcript_21929:177-1016(-)